jgi:hypothetical protein
MWEKNSTPVVNFVQKEDLIYYYLISLQMQTVKYL